MTIELKRILLVEDSPNDIELTLEALAEHNLANIVEVARDGEEALDYLYRRGKFSSRPAGNPVVVLLDLKLPKVDGHEVLRRIRSDDNLMLIPVVILTSSREEQDLLQGYKSGANAYVVKPVDFHEFLEAMKAFGVFWAVLNEAPPSARQTQAGA
jgi:CheY-like chemotaxis protein